MLGLMDKIMYKGRKFIPDRSDLNNGRAFFFKPLEEGTLPWVNVYLYKQFKYYFVFNFAPNSVSTNSISFGFQGLPISNDTEVDLTNTDLAKAYKTIKINRCTDHGNFTYAYSPQHFSPKEESLYDYVRDILNGGVFNSLLTHINHLCQCFNSLFRKWVRAC